MTDGIWDRAHGRLTVGLLLVVSIAAFEALAVATVLPAAVADLGGLGWYGWVFSGFMLSNLIGISIAGRLADGAGPARAFVLGACLFVAGLVIAGAAPAMALIVVGRVAQGLGAGGLSSVAYVAVARGYAKEAQPRMLALLASAWVVPGLIGPALAGSVADHLGWRWVFLGLAPLTGLAASLSLSGLRGLTPAARSSGEHRIGAAVRLAAGAAIALLGAESTWWLAAAAVGVGALVAVPALRQLLPPGTLRARPGAPAALAVMLLLNCAFFGSEAFLPLSLTAVRGQSTTMAGVALTAGTLSWTTGAWVQSRLVMRHGWRVLVATGLALTAVGIAGATTVLIDRVPAITVALSWGVAGLGIGVAYSTISLVVLADGADGREGAAAAALQLANVLGAAVGTGVGGAALSAVTAAGGSQAGAIGLVNAIMTAAAVCGLAVSARVPVSPAPDAPADSLPPAVSTRACASG